MAHDWDTQAPRHRCCWHPAHALNCPQAYHADPAIGPWFTAYCCQCMNEVTCGAEYAPEFRPTPQRRRHYRKGIAHVWTAWDGGCLR